MKVFYIGCFLLNVFLTPLYVFGFQKVTVTDTNEVIKLNKDAYNVRKSSPKQTIKLASNALQMAQAMDYKNGIAESYRVLGIGYSYMPDLVLAFKNYSSAFVVYEAHRNHLGMAKVENNIGNLFRDTEADSALKYFSIALPIAKKVKDSSLIASITLNIGNVYVRQKEYHKALVNFAASKKIFKALGDSLNVVSCNQNAGVAFFDLKDLDNAEKYLLYANAGAKELPNMNSAIASIDLTLADIYITKRQFDKAQKYIDEGSQQVDNENVKADFLYTKYQLEYKRKNYKEALSIRNEMYNVDSAKHTKTAAEQISLYQIKAEQDNTAKEQQRIISRTQNNRYLFWGAMTMTFLMIILVALLVVNVKRKAETNKKLNDLNNEVLRQKDNLNRINHHLEEIIDERTKDLQIKNKKLSEYSSYLSHQIRGPIATLKGLMNLEREGLVDEKECINMMNKCVSEIDEKIIDMSEMLHDPDRAGF